MSDVRHVRCPTDISHVRIENFYILWIFVVPMCTPSLGFPEIPLIGTPVFGTSLLGPIGPSLKPPYGTLSLDVP